MLQTFMGRIIASPLLWGISSEIEPRSNPLLMFSLWQLETLIIPRLRLSAGSSDRIKIAPFPIFHSTWYSVTREMCIPNKIRFASVISRLFCFENLWLEFQVVSKINTLKRHWGPRCIKYKIISSVINFSDGYRENDDIHTMSVCTT